MSFSYLVLAAAAAAQAAAPHAKLDAEQARAANLEKARAEGMAEAQRALAASNGETVDEPVVASASDSPLPATPAPASSAPVQPGAVPHALALTCLGGGTANKVSITSAWGGGHFSGFAGGRFFSGSTYGNAMALGTRQQGFADQTDVQLFSGDDRIRLPRTMLPMFHGGQAGWFKLKDVVADARSIRASVAVFAFHNPKVYIDRVTGTISISGKDGDYVGRCQAMRQDAVAKF